MRCFKSITFLLTPHSIHQITSELHGSLPAWTRVLQRRYQSALNGFVISVHYYLLRTTSSFLLPQTRRHVVSLSLSLPRMADVTHSSSGGSVLCLQSKFFVRHGTRPHIPSYGSFVSFRVVNSYRLDSFDPTSTKVVGPPQNPPSSSRRFFLRPTCHCLPILRST